MDIIDVYIWMKIWISLQYFWMDPQNSMYLSKIYNVHVLISLGYWNSFQKSSILTVDEILIFKSTCN